MSKNPTVNYFAIPCHVPYTQPLSCCRRFTARGRRRIARRGVKVTVDGIRSGNRLDGLAPHHTTTTTTTHTTVEIVGQRSDGRSSPKPWPREQKHRANSPRRSLASTLAAVSQQSDQRRLRVHIIIVGRMPDGCCGTTAATDERRSACVALLLLARS